MAARAAQTHLTPEEYIALERKAIPDADTVRKDWIFTAFQALEDILPLTSIQCQLPLQEIYERVTFPD